MEKPHSCVNQVTEREDVMRFMRFKEDRKGPLPHVTPAPIGGWSMQVSQDREKAGACDLDLLLQG